MTLKQVVEALVFASSRPISTKEILAALAAAGEQTDDQLAREYANAREIEIVTALAELQAEYAKTGHSFQLVEQAVGWALVSLSAAAPWVRQLYPEAKPTRLTGPQLETLAIVAYRQPVTRADIEAVRGVAVDGVMQLLLDRGLVKISGRADVPGRPLLYQTTHYFLQHFGLKTVDDLPNSAELKRVALPTPPRSSSRPRTSAVKSAAENADLPGMPPAQSATTETAPDTSDAAHQAHDPVTESTGPSPIES